MSTPTDHLVELARKSIDDIKELATQVTNAVAQLDKIRQHYDKSKWNKFMEFLGVASPILSPIITLIGLYFLSRLIDCNHQIHWGDFLIPANCK